MGEAKRRKASGTYGHAYEEGLKKAAKDVGWALQRLATAASGHFGSDCYLHAEFGRQLLADLGLEAKLHVGYAAWRVGPGDGDVIGHTPHTQGYLPAGAEGMQFHVWLTVDNWLVDFTTYQLPEKGKALDAADGGHTTVAWHPDVLVLPLKAVASYRQVAQALDAGHAYYEEDKRLLAQVPSFQAHEDDLAAARLLLRNPEMQAIGPNHIAGIA